MADKPKCSVEDCERDASHKGLCSGCYGKQWREARKAERAALVAPAPKQLTSGVTNDELTVIEGEVIHDAPHVSETHLTALNPAEMHAAQGDMRAHLEQKLTIIERDIVEANAALNEARRNGWATIALVHARNRLIDDETYYNKLLMATEAGYTVIPEFPIDVFAVRAGEQKSEEQGWIGPPSDTYLERPVRPECLVAGAGGYRNPLPAVSAWPTVTRKDSQGVERTHWTQWRSGNPVGPIVFPSMTARSPIMRATAAAMEDKVFDQIGVCRPVISAPAARVVQDATSRAGDPLVIGQVLHKRVGSKQRCVSFIIAWYLNLEDL